MNKFILIALFIGVASAANVRREEAEAPAENDVTFGKLTGDTSALVGEGWAWLKKLASAGTDKAGKVLSQLSNTLTEVAKSVLPGSGEKYAHPQPPAPPAPAPAPAATET